MLYQSGHCKLFELINSVSDLQRAVNGFLCPSNYPSWYDLYSVESDV